MAASNLTTTSGASFEPTGSLFCVQASGGGAKLFRRPNTSAAWVYIGAIEPGYGRDVQNVAGHLWKVEADSGASISADE